MIIYSVANDTAQGAVNLERLGKEIVAANCVTNYEYATTVGNELRISCGAVADQAVLDAVIHAHTAVSLADKKGAKVLDIDARTREIIAEGFSFDGQKFSLSQQAQTNWLGLAALSSFMSWPMNITTNADTSYALSLANMPAFIGTGAQVIKDAIGSGRALKITTNAASTQEELDVVVDDR